MQCMLAIPGTIFFHFQAPGCCFLVFPGAIVAALAFRASHDDVDSHGLLDNFSDNAGTNCVATFTDCETQPGFHCDGIDQFNNEL